MILSITTKNYCQALDRLDELWWQKDPTKEQSDELEVLADLLSAYEEIEYPIMNTTTYRDLLNERLKISR